jgi:hypothetical protein
MIDPLQQVPSQPESNPTTPTTPQTQKSNRNIWIIAGIAAGIICLCSIACVALFGATIFKVFTEREPVGSVLDAYMRYMADKDAESAYALFSPRAQRQIPFSKVEEMLEGNNYFLFEGYQSLEVGNLNISATANANPDLPQGTVANVTGTITFEGDIQGTFNGVLEKVDDEWMIDSIYVSVPPNKIK